VRALFESRNLKVSRVIQVMFGDFELPRDLPRGKHRELSDNAIEALYASAELTVPTAPPKPQQARAQGGARRRPAPDRRKKKRK
jgi:23S rRNA pseudouridine2605 synthase